VFVNARDLSRRLGEARFKQLFDQNLNGRADADLVAEVCTDANREIESLLLGKGFTHDQLEKLAQDETLRRAGCWIAAEMAVFSKPEMVGPDGTTAYSEQAKRAREMIKTIASGERRLAAEQVAGPTASIRGHVSEPTPGFYVAPSIANPKGPGGF